MIDRLDRYVLARIEDERGEHQRIRRRRCARVCATNRGNAIRRSNRNPETGSIS